MTEPAAAVLPVPALIFELLLLFQRTQNLYRVPISLVTTAGKIWGSGEERQQARAGAALG